MLAPHLCWLQHPRTLRLRFAPGRPRCLHRDAGNECPDSCHMVAGGSPLLEKLTRRTRLIGCTRWQAGYEGEPMVSPTGGTRRPRRGREVCACVLHGHTNLRGHCFENCEKRFPNGVLAREHVWFRAVALQAGTWLSCSSSVHLGVRFPRGKAVHVGIAGRLQRRRIWLAAGCSAATAGRPPGSGRCWEWGTSSDRRWHLRHHVGFASASVGSCDVVADQREGLRARPRCFHR
mmetsp:Transcript_40717/g.107670  ORF Transcript_40717/g.107670 Transcript_40717/m.107670 type:complete len:233 (+) Transcript_40717:243-941(+)